MWGFMGTLIDWKEIYFIFHWKSFSAITVPMIVVIVDILVLNYYSSASSNQASRTGKQRLAIQFSIYKTIHSLVLQIQCNANRIIDFQSRGISYVNPKVLIYPGRVIVMKMFGCSSNYVQFESVRFSKNFAFNYIHDFSPYQ